MAKRKNPIINFQIVLIFVICTIFFFPFFIKPSLLTGKDNDLGRTYIPIYSFVKDSFINNNEVPLWRPDQMMGESLIGNPISTLMYPPNILFILFPVSIGSIIFIYLHFLLSGFSTYLLAKDFKLSDNASLAASIFFTFSTKMLLHLSAGHITMIAAFCYLPVILLLTRKLLVSNSLLNTVVLSITGYASYLLHPTVFYYSVLFCFFYSLYFLFTHRKKYNGISFLTQKLIISLIALTIFLGLVAIVLIPQLEFAALSNRVNLHLQDIAIPLWNFNRFTQSLLMPYLIIRDLDHEAILYLGMIIYIFSVIGFFKLSKIKKIIFITFWTLTLLFVAGLSTPFFKFAYTLFPFLKYSRVTTRLWFVVALIFSMLAAYGLDKIKNKWVVYAVIILFLLESMSIFIIKNSSVGTLNFKNDNLYKFLASDKELFRVYCTTSCFNSQLLGKYHLQILNGETPLQEKETVNFLERAGNYNFAGFNVIFPPYQVWQVKNPPQPNAEILGTANVKYIASTYPLASKNFIFITDFYGVLLYQNTYFKNRAYFKNSQDRIQIVKYSANNILIKIDKSNVPRTLIFSDKYYPGWVATGVSQNLPITKSDIFREIIVPPYTDYIKMEYKPKSFVLGKTITIGTIVFLILFFLKKVKYG